jgi:hypothetical protein
MGEPIDRTVVRAVLVMAVAIFVLGISLLLIGLISKDWKVAAPSPFITGFMYWPINKVLKIRMESMILTTALTLVEPLPPEAAADYMMKVIEMILEYDQKSDRESLHKRILTKG